MKVTFPHYTQHDAMDCGPTCLRMVAPLPCIVHWNQSHFVVVYKISPASAKQKYVWVADPGAGKLKYTKEEFCNCWLSSKQDGEETGIALILEPTPAFYAEEDERVSRKGFGFLFSYLRPYRKLIIQLFLGLLLGSLIQLALPFLTQSVVDFRPYGFNKK